jgi:hypothetical protein
VPGVRTVALAGLVGIGVAVYFSLWFRWPTFLAIAIGATVGVVLLLIAASLAGDPAAADAAWRAAAPDLARRERPEPPDADGGVAAGDAGEGASG